MNPELQRWGTWLLSSIFTIIVVVSLLGFLMLLIFMAHSKTRWDALWFLAVGAPTLCLPPSLTFGGLYLWRNARFAWFAVIPVLIAIASVWMIGSLTFGSKW